MRRRTKTLFPETEAANPRSRKLGRMSTLEIVKLMNDEDVRVAPAVGRRVGEIAALVDDIVERMSRGGRLVYVGAGTSGRLAMMDAVECVPTFGVKPGCVRCIIAGGKRALHKAIEGAEDEASEGVRQIRKARISRKDFVAGVSASGRTPFVLGALQEAKRMGAGTALITCSRVPKKRRVYDRAISVLVGPEVITGSTRMKAGTATKLVLNTISTAVMVRLGRVRGNIMAFVRPGSKKLWRRAVRAVMDLGHVGRRPAEEALRGAGGSVVDALERLAKRR